MGVVPCRAADLAPYSSVTPSHAATETTAAVPTTQCRDARACCSFPAWWPICAPPAVSPPPPTSPHVPLSSPLFLLIFVPLRLLALAPPLRAYLALQRRKAWFSFPLVGPGIPCRVARPDTHLHVRFVRFCGPLRTLPFVLGARLLLLWQLRPIVFH